MEAFHGVALAEIRAGFRIFVDGPGGRKRESRLTRQAPATPSARAAVVFLLLSGAAAIAYEVVWARMLRGVLGSTVEAVATVLAVYFAGLALGALLAGRAESRASRPGRLYAALEVAIGLAALATIPAIGALEAYAPSWEAGMGALWGPVRVALLGALLLPAATAMGATFPVMLRVVGARPDGGREIGRLYAANTLGGVFGASLAGFVALGTIGCRATILVGVGVNLGVALASRLVFRDAGSVAAPVPRSGAAAAPVSGLLVLVATFVAGAGVVGAEVVWTRAMVFGFGTSAYAFTSILIAVLVSIALGSAIYSRWPPRQQLARALGIVLVAEGAALALSAHTFGFMDLLALYGAASRMSGFLPRPVTWPLLWIGVAMLVAAPATLLSGYAFPLAAHARGLALGSAPRGSGEVGAANTAGTILGSLLAGFWLLPIMGVGGSIAVIAVVVTAVGATLVAHRPALRLAGAGAAALAVWLVGAGAPGPGKLHADIEKPGDRVLFAREGAQASVRVFEQAVAGTVIRRLAIDGQTIASNSASDLMVKEVVLAHLPILLHPAPRRVALIGLGTGITLGGIASHPEVEEMLCVEIVPEVWAAARLFEDDNGHVLDDPRLTAVAGDGLQVLRGTPRRFDVVVGDEKVSLHSASNGTFFSRDYYRLVRERLAPGGVFVQWVPLLLPLEDQRTVLRTFFSVFDDGVVLTLGRFGFVQVGGLPTPGFSHDRVARALSREDVRRALAFPTLDLTDPTVLAASVVGRAADLRPFVGDGPIQTADLPVLDYGIARWDFSFETYRARAVEGLAAFAAIVGRGASPWTDDGVPRSERLAARAGVRALLEAHRREAMGDAAGVLGALPPLDAVPALRPIAERYRTVITGAAGGPISGGPGAPRSGP